MITFIFFERISFDVKDTVIYLTLPKLTVKMLFYNDCVQSRCDFIRIYMIYQNNDSASNIFSWLERVHNVLHIENAH